MTIQRKGSDDPTKMFRYKRVRQLKCKNKDSVLMPILKSLDFSNPKQFRALLMPCLWGPELSLLRDNGVPGKNIFVIERDKNVWQRMRMWSAGIGGNNINRNFVNVNVAYINMPAHEAIDFFYYELDGKQFDLVYCDFFGQPDNSHIALLKTLFKGDMVKSMGKLLLTFGKARCRRFIKEINSKISESVVPTEEIVLGVAKLTGRHVVGISSHRYVSSEGAGRRHYQTTEVDL